MSNLTDYIQKMADEAFAKTKRNRGTEKRLTVILSDYDHRRLKYISEKLGEPASTFARNLIMQALTDAERILHLDELDDMAIGEDDDGDFIYPYSDYGNYINRTNQYANDDTDDDDDTDDTESTKKTTRAPRQKKEKLTAPPLFEYNE